MKSDPSPVKLFAEITAAIVTLLLAAAILERAFDGYTTPIDYTLGQLKPGAPVTLLIVGNSHTGALGSIGLRVDDVTYNASVGGQDIFRSYLLLRAYLPTLPRLREALVALDYDAIGYNLSVFNQDWQDRQYYRYTKELYHDGPIQRLLAESAFFRANRDWRALFSSAPGTTRALPMLPVTGRFSSTHDRCRQRAKEQSEIKFRTSLIGENSGYLEKIVTLGKRYNVKIHFLNTPKADCYCTSYAEATRRDGRAAILRALKTNAPDFVDYFDIRFPTSDFLDDDHLNPAGAEKLMRDLAARTLPMTAPPQVKISN